MTDLLEPDGDLWRWVVANGGRPKDSLWPPDSETDAHDLAQAWTDAAKVLRDAVEHSDQAAADLRATWTDAAGFEMYYAVHSLNHGDTGDSGIAGLATAMDGLAALCQDYANKVSSAKFLIRTYIAQNESLFAHCTSLAGQLVFVITVASRVAKIQTDLADNFGKPPEPKKPDKPHGFWGNVGEFFAGIGEGAKEMVVGFGALVGYADGHWSWSTAGQAWGGLGKFALAAATYAVPGLSSIDQTYGLPGFERGEMGRTLVDAGKSLVAWDEWSDDPARAGGKATFNIVSSVLGTKGAGAAMRGAGAAAAGSRIGAVAAAGRVLETTGSAITKIPTATEVAGKVVRKIPGVEGALSRVGLGRSAPHVEEPAPRREGGSGEGPPGDPPGGPPPENVPSRPNSAREEGPGGERRPDRTGEHTPSERAPERPVRASERPAEHASERPGGRALEEPAERPAGRSAEHGASEGARERSAEPAARPGSVGEAMGRETHGNQPHTAAEPGRGEAPAAHRNPEPSGRHEPGDTAPWRDAKAELDPRTQQARLTGSLEPAREAHATTGVGSDHFLEQERWAGAASPEPKTPTQKVAFAVLRGLGVLHTGIDMVAGHDLLPTSKLTPLHPPKDHKPKGHEEKPAEPAPESTSDPKPGDPAVPPKPGEGAVAHVDPDTLKVDHVEPAERPHPEPTPAGAPAGRGHPSSDIDRAINPDAAHEHGPRPDDPPPDGAHEHGPHPDDPPPPDPANAHAESTPSGSSFHAGDPDLGDLPHRVPPDPDGRYTVDVHVTPDGHARIGDHHYTPKEFADVLRRNADYDGGPIRLIGCDASSNAFAHGLARELDTEVLAPTKAAWTDSRGRVFSSGFEIGPDGRLRPRIPPDGEWNTHHPDGSTHRAGEDGFAPGTHHGDPHDVDVDSAVDRGQRPYDPAERDQDMRDLRRENRDLREEGLDSVRHHDGRNVNPTTDDLRRPHDRALTTSRYRSLEGGAEGIHSFSGKTHDWAPASEGPSYPKHERLFETKEAGAYRPELGRPDPEVKFGRTHDSEPKLMEELVRRDFAERSGLPRGEVDDIVRKQIEKLRREEATGSRAYDNGLMGDIARARDRMDGALDEINRRGAELAHARGETHEPVTREGMDGDLRMVVDLPSAKRDNIPVDYQICDSCQDVIMQFEKLFPNVRVEVVNIKGEELIW